MTDFGLGSWPERRARMTPDKLALVQQERRLSYRQLSRDSAALAVAFAGAGVRAGDRIAYLGPNDIATFEAFFAAASLGAIFTPLNTRLAPPEIAYMLDDCTPSVLIAAPELQDTARRALAAASAQPDVWSAAGQSGCLRRTVPAAIDSHREHSPPEAAVSLDDPALILYTSGTTGRPKGAVLSHGNITFNTLSQFAHFSLSDDDVTLCSAPLFHVLGLGQITLPTLFVGGTVIVVARFDPGAFLAAIARERATAFPLAPTMMQMLCEHPDWARTDLSSVQRVVFGGSPIAERVAAEWLARGVKALQGYGMTEAAPGVLMALDDGAAQRPLSAGVPHFFTDIALLADTGQVVSGPGQGELLVRGPNVFQQYWNRPEETAAAFTGEWFRTGDIVRVDRDGWCHIIDRVKDMIISGGENIYPAEIEAAMAELPQVAAAAVIGVPDDRWGEVGAAFVQLAGNAALSEEQLRAHLHQRLARYKVPRYVTFVDELPRNAAGKLLRRPLRDAARRHVRQAPP